MLIKGKKKSSKFDLHNGHERVMKLLKSTETDKSTETVKTEKNTSWKQRFLKNNLKDGNY